MFIPRTALFLALLVAGSVPAAAGLTLSVTAPPSLSATARTIGEMDMRQLEQVLSRAGLVPPEAVRVVLVPEDDPRARATPGWIVGRAYGTRSVIIYPQRVPSYPYDSLSSVLRHEVVHLALNHGAAGRPMPRWFHEGVAVDVEGGWGVTDRVRLLLSMAAGRPTAIADVDRLFESVSAQENTRAYLLVGALVNDLRQRSGAMVPGNIAAGVAGGVPFAEAFEEATGETADAAAARAWSSYRRWTEWIPVATGSTALWTVILLVAAAAFLVRRRRSAWLRARWEEEERSPPTDLPES